jgi:hypothetical protein
MCVRAAVVEASTVGRVLTKRQILGSVHDSFQMLEVTKEVLWSESEAANTVIKKSRMRRILYNCDDPIIGVGRDGRGHNIYGLWMSVARELHSILSCAI